MKAELNGEVTYDSTFEVRRCRFFVLEVSDPKAPSDSNADCGADGQEEERAGDPSSGTLYFPTCLNFALSLGLIVGELGAISYARAFALRHFVEGGSEVSETMCELYILDTCLT